MKNKIWILVCFLLITPPAWSADEHDEHGPDHTEERSETPENVGPEKGIVAIDDHDGFKLSPEAEKNFEIRAIVLKDAGPWTLPKMATVRSGSEVSLYRRRAGFIKRIDFTPASQSGETIRVSSKDLRPGDEILIAGLGFVRIAELAATGGMAEGHSH
ncbi:MAG: hypothetical protein KF767_18410 [Bdellovibrionaceae bacterium]|nr:hypothetical protein [Pseudobdellovibrionaceae bacterium]